MMLEAKFNLRSWASNSKQLQAIATRDNVVDKNLTVNTLGLRWNTCTDMITFALNVIISSDSSCPSDSVSQDSDARALATEDQVG